MGSDAFWLSFYFLAWPPILILVIHFHYSYLPFSPIYNNQLAITSSSYGVLFYYRLYGNAGDAAADDPPSGSPDGLSRPGRSYAEFTGPEPSAKPLDTVGAVLLRMPELELLGRHYGVMLRIQYKQQLSEYLSHILQPNEMVYHLSGHDTVIRLNSDDHQNAS